MAAGGIVWLGLDIGGTKVAAALVDGEGRVRERVELPTLADAPFDVSFRQVVQAGRALLDRAAQAGYRVAGVGAGCPGPLDPRTGVLHGPPNLPAWDGVPVRARLREALGLPVAVDNDANTAALGEAWCGAGRGFSLVVYFTLGTGVGGAVVREGRIFAGARGAAAELGHLIVEVGGEPCACGGRGCLEAYASGPAVVRRVVAALAAADTPTDPPVASSPGRPGALTDARGGLSGRSVLTSVSPLTAAAVVDAVRQGDGLAARVWEETMDYLAAGVLSAVHAFNPDVVVVGGGLAAAGDLLFEPVRRRVREWGMPYLVRELQILPAALGRDAGVVGAAVLARQELGQVTGRRPAGPRARRLVRGRSKAAGGGAWQ